MGENYTVYHLHSDRSLLDSCTNFKAYIDKASELGMKAIGFSEHGNIYNWTEKKMYCDKKGIKHLIAKLIIQIHFFSNFYSFINLKPTSAYPSDVFTVL